MTPDRRGVSGVLCFGIGAGLIAILSATMHRQGTESFVSRTDPAPVCGASDSQTEPTFSSLTVNRSTLAKAFGPTIQQSRSCYGSPDAVSRELLIAALRRADEITEPSLKADAVLYIAEIFECFRIASAEQLVDEAQRSTAQVANVKQKISLLLRLVEAYRIKEVDASARPVETELMQEALELSQLLEPSAEMNESLEKMAAWFTQQGDEERARQAIAHLAPDYPGSHFLESNLDKAVVERLVESESYEAAADRAQDSKTHEYDFLSSKDQALAVRLDSLRSQIFFKAAKKEDITTEITEIQKILKQASAEAQSFLTSCTVTYLFAVGRSDAVAQIAPEIQSALDQAIDERYLVEPTVDEDSTPDDAEYLTEEADRDFELYEAAEQAVSRNKHELAQSLLSQMNDPYSRLEHSAYIAAAQSERGASQEVISTLVQSFNFFQSDPNLRDDVEAWKSTFVADFIGQSGRFQELQDALPTVKNQQYRQILIEAGLGNLAYHLRFQERAVVAELTDLSQRIQRLPRSEQRSKALIALSASFSKAQEWQMALSLTERLTAVEQVRSLLAMSEAQHLNAESAVTPEAEVLEQIRVF